MQIYISHSGSDRDLALDLIAQLNLGLRDTGLTIWNPYRSILPGDNWAQATGQALNDSEVLIVLWTRNAQDPAKLQGEVQFALTAGNYHGRVIPVVFDKPTFTAGKDVPWILLQLDPLYIPPQDVQALVARLKTLAGAGCNAAH